MSTYRMPDHSAVLTIEPVTDAMREAEDLPAEATLALIETFRGESVVLSTDDECPFGIEAAASAWAQATGAAYGGGAS